MCPIPLIYGVFLIIISFPISILFGIPHNMAIQVSCCITFLIGFLDFKSRSGKDINNLEFIQYMEVVDIIRTLKYVMNADLVSHGLHPQYTIKSWWFINMLGNFLDLMCASTNYEQEGMYSLAYEPNASMSQKYKNIEITICNKYKILYYEKNNIVKRNVFCDLDTFYKKMVKISPRTPSIA